MKLQGKKTGTFANFIGYIEDDLTAVDSLTGNTMLTVRYKDSGANCYKDYRTIAEFNEDWEDYKPQEPLIKDEKIRKAVRAWAEANDVKWVKYSYDGNSIWYGDNEIGFKYLEPLALELNELYGIAELCGEEEE